MNNKNFKAGMLMLVMIFAVACEYDETPYCYHGNNNEDLVFFDEILAADDFEIAANELASDFRCEMGLPKLAQVGVVTDEVEGSARQLESEGFNPVFILQGTLPRWDEPGNESSSTQEVIKRKVYGPWYPSKWGWKGRWPFRYWGVVKWDREVFWEIVEVIEKPVTFTGKNGFLNEAGIDIELVSAGTGSDYYRNDIVPGRMVVQHIGFFVNDVDDWVERFDEAGYELAVRGRIEAGPVRVEFANINTAEDAGYDVEFLKFTFEGHTFTPGPYYKTLGTALKLLPVDYIDGDNLKEFLNDIGLGFLA